jgi:hypothetical protein
VPRHHGRGARQGRRRVPRGPGWRGSSALSGAASISPTTR